MKVWIKERTTYVNEEHGNNDKREVSLTLFGYIDY